MRKPCGADTHPTPLDLILPNDTRWAMACSLKFTLGSDFITTKTTSKYLQSKVYFGSPLKGEASAPGVRLLGVHGYGRIGIGFT